MTDFLLTLLGRRENTALEANTLCDTSELHYSMLANTEVLAGWHNLSGTSFSFINRFNTIYPDTSSQPVKKGGGGTRFQTLNPATEITSGTAFAQSRVHVSQVSLVHANNANLTLSTTWLWEGGVVGLQ